MTGKAALQSLSVTAFRGSSKTLTLGFEAGKTLTLVYGENGTGKTTICDALEFIGDGNVGSLKDRGLGTGLSKYIPTAGRTAPEIEVKLVSAAGECSARLNGSSVSAMPPELRPKVKVLRRQQILKLVEASPADRYKEIKDFVEIEGYEKSEQALRDLITRLGNDRSRADELFRQSLEHLSAVAPADQQVGGLPGWAEAEASKSQHDADLRAKAIATLRDVVSSLKALPDRADEAQAHWIESRKRAELAQDVVRQAKASVAHGADELIDVLEAGLRYVAGRAETEACPLCESGDRAEHLAARIESRLGALTGLKRARAHAGELESSLAAAEKANLACAEEALELVRRYGEALDAVSELSAPTSPPPTAVTDLRAWLSQQEPMFEAWADEEGRCRTAHDRRRALTSALDTYLANQAKIAEIDVLKPRAEAALSICMEERKTFTENRIGEIAKVVGALYEEIHPGEGLDKISFPLDPKRRASLEMIARFGGDDRPPQAYFSQSHLDTLALCVLLALAKRGETGDVILVLDDVLGSVDEPHVDRVIELIYDVSTAFRHTILTTHYRPWREKFRHGHLKRGDCQFVELIDWTLEDGVRLTSARPEVDRLKAMLAQTPIDAQAVAGKAGVLLEHILDNLTLRYGCAVPRKTGEAYTLGDLLPSVKGALRKALRVEVCDPTSQPPSVVSVPLQPLLDAIESNAGIRNAMGAHFKAIGQHLNDGDARRFGELVVELADALICPTHGWPGRNKTGSYWQNGGDTRRLHPLLKPQ
ncbi:AAA family ATPase [Brevundimonas sp.]|uniref:AAA family ATPase n=1 Tax=Brevundimonas sp. TaxID=1871086 RepID=UPI002FC5CB20